MAMNNLTLIQRTDYSLVLIDPVGIPIKDSREENLTIEDVEIFISEYIKQNGNGIIRHIHKEK